MTSIYELIDSLLFLFDYSKTLRPTYLIVVVLAVLVTLLLFVKQPLLNVARGTVPWRRAAALALTTIVVFVVFSVFQYQKLLVFDDGPRCDTGTVSVLYLPLWTDAALAPYLDETYQHFSSSCEDLELRIAEAPSGWTRHLTLALHLLLSFTVTALITLCLANIVHVARKAKVDND